MQRLGLSLLAGTFSIASVHAEPGSTNALTFDPARSTSLHVTIDGVSTEVLRYQVVYVTKPTPVDLKRLPTFGPPPGAMPSGAGASGASAGPGTSNASTPLNGVPLRAPAPPNDPLAYQSMTIYVPVASLKDTQAPIILQVNNGGWMASANRDILREGEALSSTSQTDNTGAALKAGYVVVSVGTRSRGIRGLDGDWVGKAPAVVVDAKAAIRYLRLNDAVMPGSADRIVITGGSGGGGLSVVVAASGNSPDYLPYLSAIGAAGVDAKGHSTLRDDVFATIAYCPINDLGNADTAYEWQFNAVRSVVNTQGGQYTAQAKAASAELAARHADVLTGLHLKREDGSPLTADTLQQSITALVTRGVETAIARGDKIPALGEDFEITLHMGPPPWTDSPKKRIKNDWLQVEAGKVKHIDYLKFLNFVAASTPLKGVPAFDATANTGHEAMAGENSLFGSAKVTYSNFTDYAWRHNEVKGDGSGADDTGETWAAYLASPTGAELAWQLKMVSPLPYLRGGSTTAPYWYVRHGLIDRDTSFATQATLFHAIQNNPAVQSLNFRFDWLEGHGGNYDVQEAYAWLASVVRQAGAPTVPTK